MDQPPPLDDEYINHMDPSEKVFGWTSKGIDSLIRVGSNSEVWVQWVRPGGQQSTKPETSVDAEFSDMTRRVAARSPRLNALTIMP